MRKALFIISLGLLLLANGVGAAEKGLTVKAVRSSTYAAFTRIVFEVEAAAPYALTRAQDGRSITLGSYEGPFLLKAQLPAVHDGVVAGLEARAEGGRNYVVVRFDAAAGDVKDFTLRGPDRIVIDIAKGKAPVAPPPTGGRPLVVVLDPGHGGRDAGLATARGLEKSAVLELAQAVKKLLQGDQRITVLLTRGKDQSLSLDERAAFANASGAAVFVALHGAEGADSRVYIQDVNDETNASTLSSPPAGGDFLGYEAGSGYQETVWGTQQAAHEQESSKLGRRLARQLAGVDSAEPVQAPIAGVEAVDAAAVMVEIGSDQDQAKVAEHIAGGIEQYVRNDR